MIHPIHEETTMTDGRDDQGLDAPLDIERDDPSTKGDRVDADEVPGNVPTGDDESLVDKLLRVGTDAPDAADIEDPEQQL
jgi:hypothetical protein